ncbi:unnamed protein product [Arabidopsis thaliana]|uniref:Uncharacterized protein n=1 Tax=Arabidopsis thaliana TaxID=3702 RepID=A0A654FMG8_ARATH|nr:unnamed protein product [Arabidopsis thaliana]
MTMNIDDVHVAKILGVDSRKSCVVCGIVFKSDDVGNIRHPLKNAKVHNFGKSKEAMLETLVKDIAFSNVKVIVSRSSICEMTLRFCKIYKIMVLQISSDIDINSLCSIVGAIDSSQHFQPHHLGYMDSISLSEIAERAVKKAERDAERAERSSQKKAEKLKSKLQAEKKKD